MVSETVCGAHHRIFIIDGAATITVGFILLLLLPKSPRETAGGIRGKGWFTEREADIYLARLNNDDPLKSKSAHLAITWRDIFNVLGNWRLWPHLIMCLSGLQAGQGAGAWSGTILQSLGFTAISESVPFRDSRQMPICYSFPVPSSPASRPSHWLILPTNGTVVATPFCLYPFGRWPD